MKITSCLTSQILTKRMEERSSLLEPEQPGAFDLQSRITGLKDQLAKEKDEYDDALKPIFEESLQHEGSLDILELNRLRRALMIGSHAWDHQLYLLNSQLKKASDGNASRSLEMQDEPPKTDQRLQQEGADEEGEGKANSDGGEANGSSLSERIDSEWLGPFHTLEKARQKAALFSTPDQSPGHGERPCLQRDEDLQKLPLEVQKLDLIVGSAPTYISSASQMADGARMLIPQRGLNDIVIPVYDDDPASVVSYALNSKEYKEWVANKGSNLNNNSRESEPSTFSTWRSLGAMDVDYIHHGGKSNVYFAKSLDERFIIKQVVKTELDSFEDFAPEYFKYMKESLTSGSPTCLAKILGIYQVSIKHSKGGKETKMYLMVMENLFYNRRISRIYDLKGSTRSRYNPNTSGTDKVLLDMNLLETLRTEPIFLGSKAKRSLERAIWNDTNFLATVDVMDYSLLVGFDEDRKELVLGIIDFMRQYTWDKHLETWVKASGILGGPKNASPTIVSPKQYKRRFRKAMTTYFLTVPEPWTS
ncbi:putative 1-phosphatidylinositol-3-phosphate 5-kinase FAB1C [Raphanus sativus]|uniref:1-phosphatidylinositol-3-phosphate 5-kinase FAB1C n=1 Tax=Raphanus sativus TaxID=3726 RepID=A0A6J0LNK8_RAPSA|nr:putative 1-phosphatidylinositol-3-phosphate 5-kinase FAB1C [Raphanus sativus]